MQKFFEKRILNYPQDFLRDIVLAVDQYADFLPWVTASSVSGVKDNEFNGTLTVGYAPFSHAYTSFIKHGKKDDTYYVQAISHDVPFKKLLNLWELVLISPKQTEIKLTLELDMQFGLMAMALGPVFDKAAQSMIQAFEERARTLYTSHS